MKNTILTLGACLLLSVRLLAQTAPDAPVFTPQQSSLQLPETLKLIKSGKSAIKGQLFVRDNTGMGIYRHLTVVNFNKKQYAPKGTQVTLLPYTPYFKEFVAAWKKSQKQHQNLLLTADAFQCLKTTQVVDENGNYEFTNLMPGEYFIFSNIAYTHAHLYNQVVAVNNQYLNGVYQGSYPISQTLSVDQSAAAYVEKIVSIAKEGETITADLKQTR